MKAIVVFSTIIGALFASSPVWVVPRHGAPVQPPSGTVGTITTVAGGPMLRGRGPALGEAFLGLCAAAVDADRKVLYFTDAVLHRVMRAPLDGNEVEEFAGTETAGFNGDGRPARETNLHVPCELAVHPRSGDVYVADTSNYRVRRIPRDGGAVQTVAGSGVRGIPDDQLPTLPPVGPGLQVGGFSGDGGAAVSAELNLPAGVAIDSQDVLYISDSANNRVRAVNLGQQPVSIATVILQPGVIQTIAGTGQLGYSGDGALATGARLAHPRALTLDGSSLLVVDSRNDALRRIDLARGVIQTVHRARNPRWPSRDTGLLLPATVDGVMVGPEGAVYYSDLNRHAIFQIARTGPPQPRLIAGVGVRAPAVRSGDVTRVAISGPGNLTAGPGGDVYVVETAANIVRRIRNGDITLVAGGAGVGEGVAAQDARFGITGPIAVTGEGDVLIGDVNNGMQSIRSILTANRRVETFAGPLATGATRTEKDFRLTPHARATDIAFDGPDRFYFSDGGSNIVRRFVRENGVWHDELVAGNGHTGNLGNGGPARNAQLSVPIGLAVHPRTRDVYVSNLFNPMIRRISSAGVIYRFAGTGRSGFSGDGGRAVAATFNWPTAIAFDAEGNLYVTDFFNHRIRRIRANGMIETFAGTGRPGYSGDGGPASAAQFNCPFDLVFDANGDLYVADANNHAVRRIEAAAPHRITTFVGTGKRGFSGDGGPAAAALLNVPRGVAIDPKARVLYISDSLNRRIRAVRLPS